MFFSKCSHDFYQCMEFMHLSDTVGESNTTSLVLEKEAIPPLKIIISHCLVLEMFKKYDFQMGNVHFLNCECSQLKF